MKIQKLNEWIQVNAPKYTTSTTIDDIGINQKVQNVSKQNDEFGKKPVVATDKTIREIVKESIQKLGDNADLNFIDTSNVTNMLELFYDSNFNGDISKWDVSNVTNMEYMFYGSKFNGDISKWDVSNVVNMSHMFYNSKFNNNISKWNVSSVETMEAMFEKSEFNGDISKWDVSNVKNMKFMFSKSIFNQYIVDWDVKNVEVFSGMFCDSLFNGDLSKWRPNDKAWMRWMFENSKFDHDISSWNIKYKDNDNDSTIKTIDMFKNSPLEQNPPKWYRRHYTYIIEETDNIPQECIDYIIANVNDFNERYQTTLDNMKVTSASLRTENPDLFKDILDSANEWLMQTNAGYKVRPNDIVEVFDY